MNSDIELLEEVKQVLDSVQYIRKPQPIEIAFGLAMKNEEYVRSYKNYWNCELLRILAVREGEFEKAANLRDKARQIIDAATKKLLLKQFAHEGPFYFYEERVFYYNLDSRVRALLK